MGYAIRVPTVGPITATRLCAVRDNSARFVRVTNAGVAPVWLGDTDVAADRGYLLAPGDEPFVFTQPDELYAVTRTGAALLTVIEDDA